ncbi:unnamed protein product [Orchesella dallaii]|uniref:BEN domain-containing protein n=1 Tax=Orchesella dallaii TaxID=48710 RepID=A0ABP1QLB7_9HEXA
MPPTKYALIFWENENMYSAVSTKQISGFQKDDPDQHIGQLVKILWGKDLCDGRLLQLGKFSSRQSMKMEETEFSRAAAEVSFAEKELLDVGEESPYVGGEDDIFNEVVDYDGSESANHEHHLETRTPPATPVGRTEASEAFPEDQQQRDDAEYNGFSDDGLRAELAKTRAQLKEREFENRRLKRALKKSNVRIDSDTVVESIGDNFSLPKSFLDFLKLSYLGNPSLFMRRMVFDSNLFTLEEIAASSISGKKCPLTLGAARPALDPVRLKVIKGAFCGNLLNVKLELNIAVSICSYCSQIIPQLRVGCIVGHWKCKNSRAAYAKFHPTLEKS